jgi:hypothetical protein
MPQLSLTLMVTNNPFNVFPTPAYPEGTDPILSLLPIILPLPAYHIIPMDLDIDYPNLDVAFGRLGCSLHPMAPGNPPPLAYNQWQLPPSPVPASSGRTIQPPNSPPFGHPSL